ncbi:hypothetical protein ECG_04736 [Echinococcus granulosus]|uniref:Ribosomal protein S1 RNA binding domain n=1 Tax=Echinococcus granulosus TaxID=6210 RepID=A0A068WEV4_ECHGR|nr:hypothetical protein ECG_04736 [Echinococcus granulosus]CDS16961.1 Ribosomal protein S1 RNA binding domain [Echinococcus granulosus]
MRVWLTLLILPCVLTQEAKPSLLESSVNEAKVVWGGIGGLFRNRLDESSPNTCVNKGNEKSLKLLTSLYNTGVDIIKKGCNNTDGRLDENLKAILKAMQEVKDTFEQKSIVSDVDRCALQNSFLAKNSLKILSKALVNMFPGSCNITDYEKTVLDIKKWVEPMLSNITYKESFQAEVKNTINANYNFSSAPPGTIYLSDFLVDIAAISNLTEAEFYSTTMEAITAYAPPVRNSVSIKFLQNVDSTIATICSSMLQQKQTGITFIYDDSNKLVFLIRLLKNVYFSMIHLPGGWMTNNTIKELLIQQFQNTGDSQTYILLFQNEHSNSYVNGFLELAMLHQQLREGIQIILFSTEDSCSVYERYLRTGASLLTFGLSTTYAPKIPSPFFDLAWRASATYLDGLTYITENATQVPRFYILSRINFSQTHPTASPVESVAILDCSINTNTGIGSWVLNREPQLIVDSINSTLTGRTIKVGVVKYAPFYDKGIGFSVPVMDALAFLAKVNYEVVLFTPKPDEPYYVEMLKAIENHVINVGFAPVPLSAVNTEKISSSSATLTISFTLVRQRPSRPADFLLLLRPLSLPVWLAGVVLAFIFTGLLMVFGHLKPVIMRNLAEGEMTSKRDLFEMSALGVASTFSLTKLQVIPTTLSSRIFALIMWMFSYLLLVFYASAMMTILLRIRKPSNADTTVDEVLKGNYYRTFIVIKNGIGHSEIVTSLNNNSKSYSAVDSIQAAYDALMKDDKTVLLASSVEASYISVMSCALEMIPYTSLYKTILSFPYYKSWVFGPQLDYYFSIISKSGILTSSASVYFETGRCYQPNYNVPIPAVIELGDSASIYIFLLIGIIVSFIIMGLELLVKHILGEREAKEFTLLVPGRLYTAKIISIKRNGVNVNVADRPETVFIPNSQLHTDPLKVYNALDMGLAEGDSIEVTYFGKASDGVTELFCRYFPNGQSPQLATL